MQHSVEVFHRQLDQRPGQFERRGIERTIKRAVALHCAPHQRLDLILLEDVGANKNRFAATIHDPRGHSVTALLAPTRDHNLRSQPAEPLGGRLTDAGGSTDHKRDLPVERNHLICSSARFQPAAARYRLRPDASTHPPPAGRAADHLRKQPRDLG